jgi:hypothetical protein
MTAVQMGAPHYMLDAATVPAGLVAIPVPAAMRTRGGARGAPGSGGGGSGSGHHSERRVQQRKKKVQRGLEENVKRTVYISHIDQQVCCIIALNGVVASVPGLQAPK